jgi:hypothetical protein
MLKSYAKRYFSSIVQLLSKIPSPLLLVLKTNDCLRHLDKSLGAPINTAAVTANVTSDVSIVNLSIYIYIYVFIYVFINLSMYLCIYLFNLFIFNGIYITINFPNSIPIFYR